MADSQPMQTVDVLQGSSFLAIQSVMDVLRYNNVDVGRTSIEVGRDERSGIVIVRKDEPGGGHEILGVRPELRVVINARDVRELSSKVEVLDHVHGRSIMAIQIAVEVFKQHNPDLMRYAITVVREGKSLVVIFADKDRPVGTRGSVGAPGFEVELDAEDLGVRRAHFVR